MNKNLKLAAGVAGDGFWTEWNGVIHGVLRFKVFEPDESTSGFAEGRFYIDHWDESHGLIYTDSLFISDIQNGLKQLGFKHWEGINYSEAGMQGNDYVSMDASYELAKEAEEKNYNINIRSDKPGETKGEQWFNTKPGQIKGFETKEETLAECHKLLDQTLEIVNKLKEKLS
jgi:hypothetical protein